jgi:apolipoprotein N-acyltransferase
MQPPSKSKRRLLLILSGVLLGLSYPPFGIIGGFCAFFALVPLLIALEDTMRLRNAFARGYLAMFVLTLAATYWVGGWKGQGEVDPFLMISGIALDFIHPLFLIIPILLYDAMRRKFGRISALVALPIIWIGFEYWHSTGDFSFPWLSLYNTQTYNTPFIQFIEFTGSYGLSLVILMINVLIYIALRFSLLFPKPADEAADKLGLKKAVRMKIVYAIGAIFIVLYGYGFWALSRSGTDTNSQRTISITAIQPNINPWDKWSLGTSQVTDSMMHASFRAIPDSSKRSDLLLWPETAITYPITLPWQKHDRDNLYHFINAIGTPVLTGIPDREEYLRGKDQIPADAKKSNDPNIFHREWNAAMLFYFDRSGVPQYQRYHKEKLVPFGEHIPFVDALPFLGDFFSWSVGIGSWNFGTTYDIFKLPLKGHTVTAPDTAKLCAMICYESIYPDYIREFVKRGAEVITVITNDGWYGKSSGPYQHNRYAVLRAVENRRWVVRSANTGVSCSIDQFGRMQEQTEFDKSASLTARIPLLDEQTIYTKLGDFIAIPCEWICGGLILLFGVMKVMKKRDVAT